MKNIILLLSASLLLTQIFAQKFKADNFIGTQDIKQLVIRNDTLFILTNGGLVLMRNDGTHIRTISAKEGLNTRGYENLRFQEDGKLHAYYKFLSTVKEFEIDIAQDYKVKNISTTSKMAYESQHSDFRYTSEEERKDKQYKTTLNCEFSNGTTKEYFIYTKENPYFNFKEDKNGRLWAWDFDSLYYFEGDKNIALKDQKRLTIIDFFKSKDGTNYLLSGNAIYKVATDYSKLTKVDLSKFLRRDGHSFKVALQSKNGDFWVYDSYEEKLLYESNGQWDSTSVPSTVDPKITCITEDGAGSVWFGTSTGLIYQYNPSLKKWTNFPIHNPYPFNSDLEDMLIDRKGNLMASGQNGIFQIDANDNCKAFIPDESIEMDAFGEIVEDAKGSFWINTSPDYGGEGILKYENGLWREFLRDKEFSVLLSNPDNGGIYLLDKENSLYSIDSSGQTIVEKLNLIKENRKMEAKYRGIYGSYLAAGKGRLWVCEDEGSLFNWSIDSISNLINTDSTRFYRKGRTKLLKIRVSKDGTAWILSPKGLWQWKEGVWTIFEPSFLEDKEGIDVYHAKFELDANGTVWLFLRNKKRLYHFDGIAWTSSKIAIKYGYGERFFIDSKGRMWIENRREVNCFQGKKVVFKSPIISDIEEIIEDKKGQIWIRTNYNGIYRFKEEKNK